MTLTTIIVRGHVSFWQIDPSYTTMSRRTGVLDPRDKPKYFTSLAFSCTGDVVTGDSNGNIFIWARGYNAVTKVGKLFASISLKPRWYFFAAFCNLLFQHSMQKLKPNKYGV